MAKKLPKRSEFVTVRLTPVEKEIWEKKALTEHKNMGDFVRTKVNDYIFKKEAERIDVDMGPILQELRSLQELLNKREDMLELNRAMLIENAAALNITDSTLEERLLQHLGNRTLYTTQIVEYLQEDPEIIIPLLARMEKDGKIKQNNQRRWSK